MPRYHIRVEKRLTLKDALGQVHTYGEGEWFAWELSKQATTINRVPEVRIPCPPLVLQLWLERGWVTLWRMDSTGSVPGGKKGFERARKARGESDGG